MVSTARAEPCCVSAVRAITGLQGWFWGCVVASCALAACSAPTPSENFPPPASDAGSSPDGSTCDGSDCQQTSVPDGGVGAPCLHNGDCLSGICLPLPGDAGDVCTAPCPDGNASCVAGWTCASFPGQPAPICQCTPRPETCDGLDDNCDGLVDQEPQADAWCAQQDGTGYVCLNGQCIMPMCTTTADCLAGQVCDPNTKQCVAQTSPDGGNTVPDAGQTAPDSGPVAPDGGIACESKYDCSFGEACNDGTCGAQPSSCTESTECGRGDICSARDRCAAGCSTDQDCQAPEVCNMSTLKCAVPTVDGGPIDAGRSCTDSDCNGVSCVTGASCNPTTCECVLVPPPDAGSPDAGSSCTAYGTSLCAILCAEVGGTCDTAGNCCTSGPVCYGATAITCTSDNDCSSCPAQSVCIQGLCDQIAVDTSTGEPCNLSECESDSTCTGSINASTCPCSVSQDAGYPLTTDPVACK